MSGAFGKEAREELLQQFGVWSQPRRVLTDEERAERRREAARDYYEKHREAKLAYQRQYRATHAEACRASARRWYQRRKAARLGLTGDTQTSKKFSDMPVEQRMAYIKNRKVRIRHMTFADYQTLARRTQNKELAKSEKREHALMGLMSEVGEIASIYQKRHQGHSVVTSEVALELGDLLWFVSELCDVLGYDMETVAKWNIDKLRRRYPEGFDAERSLNREE